MLTFSSFDVKSQAPECINEYIDTYIEVTDRTLNNYVETNFLSRWCGWKKPYILVSYHNIIVIAFHTDGRNRDTFFKGTYEFINAGLLFLYVFFLRVVNKKEIYDLRSFTASICEL